MAYVKLVTVSNDLQVAVLTSEHKLGVCAKGETHLWALENYDANLHNSNIRGLTFLPNGTTLVAWTTDLVIAWTIDFKTRTSKRISHDDFDAVTKEISFIVACPGTSIVAVEHESSERTKILYRTTEESCVLRCVNSSSGITTTTKLPNLRDVILAATFVNNTVVLLGPNILLRQGEDGWKKICFLELPNCTLTHYGERIMFVNNDEFIVRYGFEEDAICGPVRLQNTDKIAHLQCIGSLLVSVSSDGQIAVRKAVGLKGPPTSAWSVNLQHVQNNEEAQLQIIADAETALQLEKERQAELETARKVELEELRLVHERSVRPNDSQRREFMLGAPTPMGAVKDWNDVEPHHFRSAPAVHSGVMIDGGFLPHTKDKELQELRQDVRDLKELVATLVKKMNTSS